MANWRPRGGRGEAVGRPWGGRGEAVGRPRGEERRGEEGGPGEYFDKRSILVEEV